MWSSISLSVSYSNLLAFSLRLSSFGYMESEISLLEIFPISSAYFSNL